MVAETRKLLTQDVVNRQKEKDEIDKQALHRAKRVQEAQLMPHYRGIRLRKNRRSCWHFMFAQTASAPQGFQRGHPTLPSKTN